ncbi:MAG TPA: type II secretion system protein [Candidatus Synoicihabitans sp.]|nr:type II secretion system protein [Candidatus Synoicihabitans sp.]
MGAFSILEIVLVVALIGFLATALVVVGGRLLSERPLTADEVFWTAADEARKYALLHQQDVELSFDRETRSFRARTTEGAETFPVPGEGELQIDFLSLQPTGSNVLIGGNLVETRPLRSVTFFADGTCTPFRVQLRSGGPARIIAIDPWTCAPMLTPGTET